MMLSVSELSCEVWETVFSFLSLQCRFRDHLGCVCKRFHEAVVSLGLNVSVDIFYYPSCSAVPSLASFSHADSSQSEQLFQNTRCVLNPPPNPFRYLMCHQNVGSKSKMRGNDVHFYVDVYEKCLLSHYNQGQDHSFKSALQAHLRKFLGGTLLASCVVRGPEAFPFVSALENRYFQQRRPKCDAYAGGDGEIMNTAQEHITDAWVIVTSINSFERTLKILPNLSNLSVMYDCRPSVNQHGSSALFKIDNEYISEMELSTLSLSYFSGDNRAFTFFDISVKFFECVIRNVKSVQCLSLGPAAVKHHISPLLSAALNRKPQAMSIPLLDMSEYLRLISSQRNIYAAMSSSVQCLVVSGYNYEAMTVPYIAHLIRFCGNITSLRFLIFDIGEDYNDWSEVNNLALVVQKAKIAAAQTLLETQLEVLLDFDQ